MAKTCFQEGDLLDVTTDACTTYSSGDVVVLGDRIGVATVNIAASATGAVAVTKVWKLPKVTGAITQGEKVYWDADATNVDGGTGGITTTAEGNTLAGFAAYDAASDAAKAYVKLNA